MPTTEIDHRTYDCKCLAEDEVYISSKVILAGRMRNQNRIGKKLAPAIQGFYYFVPCLVLSLASVIDEGYSPCGNISDKDEEG